MDNPQIAFAVLYIALTGIFLYLGLRRRSRWFTRLWWLTASGGVPAHTLRTETMKMQAKANRRQQLGL